MCGSWDENGKTINIEVTCGGVGKGKSRKTKIMSKNKRQRSDRARKSTMHKLIKRYLGIS